MLYAIGIQVLLSRELDSLVATGALIIPSSLYFLLKRFVVKPYYLRREKQKVLEKEEKSTVQVREARAAAEKAQKLLQNVSNRKRNRQAEVGGLVITRALYGKSKVLKRVDEIKEVNDVSSEVLDVTIPLNFLVNDAGQLKLHKGIKKSGIMGFCDPCPGEPKQLFVEYTYNGQNYQVIVDDQDEMLIPHDGHRI
ncbi:hypothetical protein Taro_032281 [Colocasia esculenta]|uniref:DnaJ-like protein C11 C-terminal domain-containing protein n=1 Tax=Colocasia esculenta TaxID=4460 RepID=A0A843VSA8_COLES|nr:hypothetical protein [Colocasia esculenta]